MDGEKVHPNPAFWFFHLHPPADAAHHLSPRLHLIINQPWFPPSQAERASCESPSDLSLWRTASSLALAPSSPPFIGFLTLASLAKALRPRINQMDTWIHSFH